MEWAGKLAGAGEVAVELARPIQRVGIFCVVAPSVSSFQFVGKTELDALVFFQIQSDEGIELSGIRDRRDISQLQSGGGIDIAADADAVIGTDALEIATHELRCRELPCAKRPMHCGNRRLFHAEGGFLCRLFI